MARKKHRPHPNHERWLVSYADFITLLFAFFVVMFATAQTDNAKTRAVSESVKKALDGGSFKSAFSMLIGGSGDVRGQGIAQRPGSGGEKLNVGDQSGLTLAELLPILSEALQKEIQSGQLSVRMTARGLNISFTQAALFPSGEDEIAHRFLSHYPNHRQCHEQGAESGACRRPYGLRSHPHLTISKQLGAFRRAQHRPGGTAHPVRCAAQTALHRRLWRYRSYR